MLETVENVLSRIHYLLSEAQLEWNKLPDLEKEKIHNLHNEGYSLDYCLRWGEIAANETREYLEGR